jgi:hypothetical protein
MSVSGDQLIAISLLFITFALGAGLFFLLILLTKWTWAWVIGKHPKSQKEQERAPRQKLMSEQADAHQITASDLYVIRANLDAISRQVEDLERKLRLGRTFGANIVNLKQK